MFRRQYDTQNYALWLLCQIRNSSNNFSGSQLYERHWTSKPRLLFKLLELIQINDYFRISNNLSVQKTSICVLAYRIYNIEGKREILYLSIKSWESKASWIEYLKGTYMRRIGSLDHPTLTQPKAFIHQNAFIFDSSNWNQPFRVISLCQKYGSLLIANRYRNAVSLI